MVADQLTPQISRVRTLLAARQAGARVIPSLLLCDFANLQREVARLEAAQVCGLHFDCMDGQFVPNLTYGMPIVEAVRRLTRLPLEAHLMIAEPERFIAAFVEAGADLITIHHEATDEPRRLLESIRRQGAAAGLAINPATPVDAIVDCLDVCDSVLIMSVVPGFGGQAFETTALDKLRQLRERAPGHVLLEVDGGVNEATIGACTEAGADLCAVGSAIFRHDDYAASVARLAGLAGQRRHRETT